MLHDTTTYPPPTSQTTVTPPPSTPTALTGADISFPLVAMGALLICAVIVATVLRFTKKV